MDPLFIGTFIAHSAFQTTYYPSLLANTNCSPIDIFVNLFSTCELHIEDRCQPLLGPAVQSISILATPYFSAPPYHSLFRTAICYGVA